MGDRQGLKGRQHGRPLNVGAQTVLFREGDEPSKIYFIEEGSVLLERLHESGDLSSRWLTAPAVVGLSEWVLRHQHAETVTTMSECTGFEVSSEQVEILMSEPATARECLEWLLRSQGASRPAKGGSDKVWQVLAELGRKSKVSDIGPWRALPSLSQERIAELAGVSRRTIARALADLRQQELIRVRRKQIWVREDAL